jgi:hypothetical protein
MKAQIAVLSFFVVSQSALAGDWHYGCAGRLATGGQVTFNRDNLVIMSRALADGKLPEEGDDELSTFQSVDNNLGFDKTMAFEHVWSKDSVARVVLTEKASKTVSSQTKEFKCTGDRYREQSRTIYLKTYEYKSDDGASPQTVNMRCYEFTITACG